MKKNGSKKILLLSMIVLGACTNPSSSEEPSSVTPSVSSETPSSSSEASFNDSGYELEVEYTSTTWPSDGIAYVLDGISVTVPSYVSEYSFIYMFIEDEYGLYIAISTEVANIASETVYNNALTSANWVIDDAYYDESGFFALDPTGEVEMQYYWFEGEFVWYIYPAMAEEEPSNSETPGSSEEIPVELESTTWPTAAITDYLGEEISTIIPSLPSTNSYFYGTAVDDGFEYFFIYTEMAGVEAESGFFDVEDTYNVILVDAGWTIDDADYLDYGFFAVDAEQTVVLQYYWWDGFFNWFFYPYEEETTSGEVADNGIATFDLSTENALVTKDENSSVWIVAPTSMTVNKGSSSIGVGNGSYFSDPLRIYQSQEVVFAVDTGYQIDSITITVNDYKPEYLTVLTSSEFTNATTEVNGQVVTLTPTDKALPVQIVASAQTRFDFVVITLSSI